MREEGERLLKDLQWFGYLAKRTEWMINLAFRSEWLIVGKTLSFQTSIRPNYIIQEIARSFLLYLNNFTDGQLVKDTTTTTTTATTTET